MIMLLNSKKSQFWEASVMHPKTLDRYVCIKLAAPDDIRRCQLYISHCPKFWDYYASLHFPAIMLPFDFPDYDPDYAAFAFSCYYVSSVFSGFYATFRFASAFHNSSPAVMQALQ